MTRKTTLTYSEYCHNKMLRINSSGVPMNGVNVWILPDGKMLTDQEMDEQYPINLPLISAHTRTLKGLNPDKSKNFLNNSKSY